MNLRAVRPGEYRYAVAVRDDRGLWLVLWIHRTPPPKGPGVYINHLVLERGWHPHTSYHADGTLWMKSHNRTMAGVQQRQPLTGKFVGVEHLGGSMGFSPHGVGVPCNPSNFSGVLVAPPGVLSFRSGSIAVDLIEPSYAAKPEHGAVPVPWSEVVAQAVFSDVDPWLVVSVRRSTLPT